MTKSRTTLVTGANRGLGFEVAKGLIETGHHVILGVRDLAKGEAAANRLRNLGTEIDLIAIDVSDQVSIRLSADMLTNRLDRLDDLVNNAGVSFDWTTPPSEISEDLLRRTFEPNFSGQSRSPRRCSRYFASRTWAGSSTSLPASARLHVRQTPPMRITASTPSPTPRPRRR